MKIELKINVKKWDKKYLFSTWLKKKGDEKETWFAVLFTNEMKDKINESNIKFNELTKNFKIILDSDTLSFSKKENNKLFIQQTEDFQIEIDTTQPDNNETTPKAEEVFEFVKVD